MKHYAGLDVSVKETSVCIVDETGKICREIKVVSHPEDLLQLLQDPSGASSGLGLRLDHCRSGSSRDWPRPGCLSSASRRATPKPFSRRR